MKFEDVVKSLTDLKSSQLELLVSCIREEQRERAVAKEEPAGLIETVWKEGFTPKGVAKDPWFIGNLLVVPGSSLNKSSTTHSCRYANISLPEQEQGDWVWDSELLTDREDGHKAKYLGSEKGKWTASIIVPVEGLQIDMISSRSRNGVHEMQKADSFVVEGGVLKLVRTRKKAAKGLGHA